MPTPFMHLHLAEQVKAALADTDGRFYRRLLAAWPAFYLGNTAPDYPTVNGDSRVSSHFYRVPPDPGNMAYPRMLATYPQLAAVTKLPPEHAFFVMGYIAHLLLDMIWLREVVDPNFFHNDGLGDRKQRATIHFALLTYLDEQAEAALPATAVTTLDAAVPAHWLPFVSDDVLCQWRNLLTAQLAPNAPSQTIAIYAGRLGLTAAEFAARLQDPVWMEAHLFSQMPVSHIQDILHTAVSRTIQLLYDYENGRILSHTYTQTD